VKNYEKRIEKLEQRAEQDARPVFDNVIFYDTSVPGDRKRKRAEALEKWAADKTRTLLELEEGPALFFLPENGRPHPGRTTP
jgi:hypothetical protein